MVTIERFCYADSGVFGKLILPSGQHLFTVERPWLNNARGISCIPEGQYLCVPRYYNRGGYKAVEITNVDNRSHILFHVANRPKDIMGCVGVGTKLGSIGGDWAILNSKLGFKAFMDEVGYYEFALKIVKK